MKIDGLKIENEIAKRKMTVAAFSRATGVPTPTIFRAIKNGNATLRTIGIIAEALNMEPIDFRTTAPAQIF